ncbi:MAG: rhomboid family intramembrane serine protease [Clostridium sp.]|jgi:rhomboid protease GluP|nr:rhomboid family intramembrane serine protease [Clostridium sp.]
MNLKENKIVNQNNIVTMIIIAINVVLYIITAIMSKNILDINAYVLLYMGGNYGALVSKGQVWRLLTCAFLHGGLIHILCNMYALYAIGPQVEILFGRVKYIIIYFFSAIGGSLLSFTCSPNNLSIGASGAIFGLFGAMVVFVLKYKDRIPKKVLNNLFGVIILNLLIGFNLQGIDNFGHIGGLLAGALVAFLILTKEAKDRG